MKAAGFWRKKHALPAVRLLETVPVKNNLDLPSELCSIPLESVRFLPRICMAKKQSFYMLQRCNVTTQDWRLVKIRSTNIHQQYGSHQPRNSSSGWSCKLVQARWTSHFLWDISAYGYPRIVHLGSRSIRRTGSIFFVARDAECPINLWFGAI